MNFYITIYNKEKITKKKTQLYKTKNPHNFSR